MKLDIQLLVDATQNTFKELFLITLFYAFGESSGEKKKNMESVKQWPGKIRKIQKTLLLYSNIE